MHARNSQSLCLGTTDNNASVLLHSNWGLKHRIEISLCSYQELFMLCLGYSGKLDYQIMHEG